MRKPVTVEQLLRTIEAFNKAHELHLQHKNAPIPPFLDNLSVAATDAALALQPIVKVELAAQKI